MFSLLWTPPLKSKLDITNKICEPVLTLLENWGVSQQVYLFSLGVLLQYAAPGVSIMADGD